jgi:hypothetical protein
MNVRNGKKEALAGPSRSRHGVFIAFLLVLAAVSLLLHMARTGRLGKTQTAKTRYAAIGRAFPIERVKAQRSRFYQSQYYLGYPFKISYAAADLVRRLYGIVGKPVRVLAVHVVPGWQKLNFELTLAVAVDKESTARTVFMDFYHAMANRLGISPAAFSGPEKPARAPGRGAAGFVFTVTGQVELEW